MMIAAFGSSAAQAESTLERLLMPGPVIEGHAKTEDNCDACHTPFSKDTQDTLCLDCHKPIRTDIGDKRGFHGKSPLMKGKACNFCHDDHLGREAAITLLDTTTFDHDMTDFTLKGAHTDVLCKDCHQTGKRWAEAPVDCFSCHQDDDRHKGQLGRDCGTCHQVTAWFETLPFNHDKTAFRLKGKHSSVPCASCHFGELYKGAGLACIDCHVIQDVHEGRFGNDCLSCHSEDGWKKDVKFKHDAMTRFPLTGAHKKADCASCHGESLIMPIARDCFSCHIQQDVHVAQLGKDCASCHGTDTWRSNIRFDHDVTRFPLTGLHAVVACEACHATRTFKSDGLNCVNCHAADDVHQGRLTARCETCHTALGWQRVTFDHGSQTNFPLKGRHAEAGCHDCHSQKNVKRATLPSDCFSCHAKEDVHRGKFGKDCARCHDAVTFKRAFVPR